MKCSKIIIYRLAVLICLILVHNAFCQNTAFTYQGRLSDSVKPVNGTYDLRFTLFSDALAGTQQGPTLAYNSAAISNGLFTVSLDFGDVLASSDRWLEIAVRTNGAGSFNALSPRQKLLPAPYAIAAQNLLGPLPISQLPAGVITNGTSSLNLTGTINATGLNIAGTNTTLFVRDEGFAPALVVTNPASAIAQGVLRLRDAFEIWPSDDATRGGRLDVRGTNGDPTIWLNGQVGGIYANFLSAGTVWAGSVVANDLSITPAGGSVVVRSEGGLTPGLVVTNAPTDPNPGVLRFRNAFQIWPSDDATRPGYFDVRATNGAATISLDGQSGTIFAKGLSLDTGAGSILLRSEGLCPGISIANSPNAGVMRFRNRLEIWPSDDHTRAGALDVRDTNGNATVTLDGPTGTVSASSLSATGLNIAGANGHVVFRDEGVVPGIVISNAPTDFNPGALRFRDRFEIWPSDDHTRAGALNVRDTNGNSTVSINGQNGSITATTFNGNGAALTSLNAANLTGSISLPRLPTEVVTNNETGLTLSGAFIGNGGGLTNLNASQLASGTVALSRLPTAVHTNNGALAIGTGGTSFSRVLAGQNAMSSGSTNNAAVFTISFPQTFSTTPKVIATVCADPTWNVSDTFVVSVRTVSTTSFTVNIVRVDSPAAWNQLLRINWMAWE